MPDVVGLIASVIAIAQVVTEQLDHFTNLVKEINNQHAISPSTVITTSLSRAKLTIEQLDQLIQLKILKTVTGTSRARRRAWTRNKSKIYELQDTLKEHRENLLAALSANSLSSANRSEATLTLISRDVSHSKETSLSLDRRLSEIEQSLLETHHAVLSQANGVQRILQSISPTFRGQLPLTELRSSLPWHPNRGFLEPAIDNDTFQSRRHTGSAEILPSSTERPRQGNERESVLESSASFAHVFPGSMFSPEPASPFEVSQNFFPEIYTTDQKLPTSCLVVTSSYEESSSADSKANFYRLFYQKSPRNWRRLSISINVCRSSVYWTATKISQHEYSTRDAVFLTGVASLPYSLLTQIQELLSEAEDVDEDAHLRFSLSIQDRVQKQHHNSQVHSFPTTAESSNASQEILAFLDDLGCPRYFENKVTQIALLEPPYGFAACVDGMLVYETKFVRSLPSYEVLYNIQLLRCMNGVSAFAKFVGIVVDTTGKHLKSYLVELPRPSRSLIPHQMTQNRLIPWKRREEWARQLVEGVSQVHSKGFVVGTLGGFRDLVLIDSSGCLQFWNFRNRFVMGYALGCYYPPEFRHFRKFSPSTKEAQTPKMTPKTDIFHLGMVMWLLAENLPRARTSPVCMREGCNMQLGLFCDESHVDPIALPRLPESIPQYYRDIVDACRTEDPNERPAAWRLLKRFPSTSNSGSSQSEEALEPESMEFELNRITICDRCRKPASNTRFFHCNICQAGDYDICQACFDRGSHCDERDHLLVEIQPTRSWSVAGTYHSIIKSSGNRDVIEL